MLKSKIAIALAAAMVMAALYGCSSGVSDSTHNQVKNQVTELEAQIQELRDQLADLEGRADVTPEQVQALRDRITALEGRPDQDEVDELRAQIAALQNPVVVDMPADVPAMAGNVEIAAGESATIGYVTYTCAAGDVGCTVTVDAHGNAVSTGGEVTAAASEAYLTKKEQERMTAVTTKSAGTKEMAIAAEAAQTADAGLGGSDHVNADGSAGNDDDMYRLTIERDRMSTTIEIHDFGMADEEKDPQFEQQMMDLGDGITMHVRDNGKGVEEVVVVSTDIEAPTGVAFDKFELADGTMPQAFNAEADGTAATVGSDEAVAFDPGDALASTDADQKAILDNMMAASFSAASGGSTSVTHTFSAAVAANPTATPPVAGVDAAEVDGTYNGAEGKYKCTGADDCTVTVNDKGMLTAASNGWIFTPDEGATSDQPDHDYLKYGFWLMTTAQDDGSTKYDEVETFAASSRDASTGGEVDLVRGSASYKGDAVGVYVHSESNTDGTRAKATSGHFTAAVNLTAIFAQVPISETDSTGTIAANLLNTVRGTIDNIELSGGETDEWEVTVDAKRALGANTFSGTAKGTMGDGSILGTFYGATPDTAADDDGTAKVAPGSMAGEFNAGFTNGSVAGAFGARIDKE